MKYQDDKSINSLKRGDIIEYNLKPSRKTKKVMSENINSVNIYKPDRAFLGYVAEVRITGHTDRNHVLGEIDIAKLREGPNLSKIKTFNFKNLEDIVIVKKTDGKNLLI